MNDALVFQGVITNSFAMGSGGGGGSPSFRLRGHQFSASKKGCVEWLVRYVAGYSQDPGLESSPAAMTKDCAPPFFFCFFLSSRPPSPLPALFRLKRVEFFVRSNKTSIMFLLRYFTFSRPFLPPAIFCRFRRVFDIDPFSIQCYVCVAHEAMGTARPTSGVQQT